MANKVYTFRIDKQTNEFLEQLAINIGGTKTDALQYMLRASYTFLKHSERQEPPGKRITFETGEYFLSWLKSAVETTTAIPGWKK